MSHTGSMSARSRRGLVALMLLTTGALAGCGAKTGEVSGKVYYKGEVLTSGFVSMVGQDGVPQYSEISEDGSYRIESIRAGEAKLTVRSPALDPAKGKPRPKRDVPGGAPPPQEGPTFSDNQKKTWRELPIRYSDIAKSGLSYTVNPGTNTYDIKMD